MIIKVINFFFILGIAAVMACGSSGTASKSKNKGGREHYEDLSTYRPNYKKAMDTLSADNEVEDVVAVKNVDPEHDVTAEVNILLDSIKLLKEDIEHINGYTIQVYTGIKKDEANEAKAKVYTTLPDSRPVIIYDQPSFRVKVGQFYTRREALKTFAKLKEVLPAAIILPEKIPVGTDE